MAMFPAGSDGGYKGQIVRYSREAVKRSTVAQLGSRFEMSGECGTRKMALFLAGSDYGYDIKIVRYSREAVSRWLSYTIFYIPEHVDDAGAEYKLYLYVDHTFVRNPGERDEWELRGYKEVNLRDDVKIMCLIPDLHRWVYESRGDTTAGAVLTRNGEVVARAGHFCSCLRWTKQTPEQINRSGVFMILNHVNENDNIPEITSVHEIVEI